MDLIGTSIDNEEKLPRVRVVTIKNIKIRNNWPYFQYIDEIFSLGLGTYLTY